jgi:hypothetical protein
MKYLKSAFVLASAMIGGSIPAFGAAGSFEPPTVTRLQENVTYSDATSNLSTYAGFAVSGIRNNGTNTINDITITISAETNRKDAFSLYRPDHYLSGLPAGCSYSTGTTTPVQIICNIKQLQANAKFIENGFTVFYMAPSTGGGISPDNINLTYRVDYAERTNDCANDCANSFREYTFPDQKVVLGTTNSILVKSAVPKFGAKLFTGTGKFATSADPWMTTLIVPGLPAGTSYVTAAIDEEPTQPLSSCINCSPNLTTHLQIPEDESAPRQIFQGTPGEKDSGWLQMELLRDASLNAGLNIKFAKVYYLPDGQNQQYVELYSCDVAYPTLDRPCIYSREQIKSNDPTVGLRGDWKFLILLLRNGRTQM